MGRHVTSLPASASMPSAYQLPEGSAIIRDGAIQYVSGGSWVTGGSGSGNGTQFDASKIYPKGSLLARGDGVLRMASYETGPGMFDESYWPVVATLFSPKGVWVPTTEENQAWADPGQVFQYGGKLWLNVIGTEQDPDVDALGAEKVAYVQADSYGGSPVPTSGTYYAIEFGFTDTIQRAEHGVHHVEAVQFYRRYPITGDPWTSSDVYRFVKKADFLAAQAAHGSLLDIPVVQTLGLFQVDNDPESGNTQVILAFDAPVDLAPTSNPSRSGWTSEDVGVFDDYVFITDRMDPYAFPVISNEQPVGMRFGHNLWTFSSENLDDQIELIDGVMFDFTAVRYLPAWQVVFDPSL
jgi:hypothetical protein